MRRSAILLLVLSAASALAEQVEEPDLFGAARGGDLELVRSLVDAGAEIDAVDRYGSTALAMAASGGHLEIVRLLLDRGADPDRADDFYGASPLGLALFYGHREVARLLLERGAEGREQALGLAVVEGDLELARAAVAGGPLYASSLEALRAQAAELGPRLAEILEAAASRPDPEVPAYSIEELHRFTGIFEGWTSDTRVEVVLREGELLAAIDGGPLRPLAATGEQSFATGDGELEVRFFGRAGTIEGIGLGRPGARAESLRRSVAEPGAGAPLGALETAARRTAEATVNWPAFRGANATGIGDGIDTPTSWDLDSGRGVRWQAEIPGLGNSSPIVWGDRVFVTTAVAEGVEQTIRTGLTGSGRGVDESVKHSWRVLAFDKATGEKLWETEVGSGVPLTSRHFKATQANSTPTTDGRHLVAVFPTAGLACLDMDGKLLWKHELGGLNAGAFTDPGQEWGFASSPLIHGSKVILQVDVHGGQYLAAWDLATGAEVWRAERRVAPSWATPTVLETARGDELVVNGSTIHGYDPETGEKLWSLAPNSELVIATPVAGDGVVYVAAGYPPVKPIYAVKAGVRGDLEVEPGAPHESLLWSQKRGGAYMPTPLLYRGLFYVVHHNGRLVVYDPATGAPVIKSRFSRGGAFTGSPVAVNGKLYVPTEEGLLYVLEAGPEYRELAINEMGEPLMATPAVSAGMLLLRTPSRLVAVVDPTEPEAGAEAGEPEAPAQDGASAGG